MVSLGHASFLGLTSYAAVLLLNAGFGQLFSALFAIVFSTAVRRAVRRCWRCAPPASAS